jgi:hypothetical protein
VPLPHRTEHFTQPLTSTFIILVLLFNTAFLNIGSTDLGSTAKACSVQGP